MGRFLRSGPPFSRPGRLPLPSHTSCEEPVRALHLSSPGSSPGHPPPRSDPRDRRSPAHLTSAWALYTRRRWGFEDPIEGQAAQRASRRSCRHRSSSRRAAASSSSRPTSQSSCRPRPSPSTAGCWSPPARRATRSRHAAACGWPSNDPGAWPPPRVGRRSAVSSIEGRPRRRERRRRATPTAWRSGPAVRRSAPPPCTGCVTGSRP